MTNRYITTSLKGFNNIMGGLPVGLPIGFYGEPKSGKSTTGIWTLLDAMAATESNGLILDAEKGIGKHVLPDMLEKYNKLNKTDIGFIHQKINFRKWLSKPSSIIPYTILDDSGAKEINVRVVDIANTKEMMLMVGKPQRIQLDGNKPKLTGEHYDLFPNDWDTPIAQLMDDPNSETEYAGILLDSLTYLMKEFGVSSQSFPVRDTAQSIILNQFTQILNELGGKVGIVILHASRPPQDSSAEVIPVGGKAVGHAFKYSAKFSVKQKEGLNTSIIIEPYRLPTSLGKLTGDVIVINDKGVF